MDLNLAGKHALVTGSNTGIGAAIAETLAAEGVAVVINGRNLERCKAVAERLAAAGARTAVACGDLSTDEGAAAVAASALAAFGQIDILVNNAGGSAELENRSWFGAATSDWMATYQANVLAAVRLIHALAPAMQERGWGRIINIGTGASITPTSAQAEYGGAKAAMLNMSLGLSKALSRTGVTSNTVSPGMIRTEGLERFLTYFAAKRGWGEDIARAEEYVVKGSGQTVTRVGEVGDIAYAVAMLASPRADFVNGANFHVDGGISPSLH
jgi:NAD(P)-dependent dehydrogenase (short-subunit alcohol dehydrogenase family)